MSFGMSLPLGAEENYVAGDDQFLAYLWQQYTVTDDPEKFRQFLVQFVTAFAQFIDVDLQRLSVHRYATDVPRLSNVSPDVLPTLLRYLANSADTLSQKFDQSVLQRSALLLQAIIVYSRNPETAPVVSSAEYMTCVVSISETVLNKLCEDGIDPAANQLTSFLHCALHYFECLYDPYFTWRIYVRGWTIDKSTDGCKPSPLHVQFVPFFYECFQKSCLDTDVQMRLFHVFGAVISGAQTNALKAICPATVDVMFKVLLNVPTLSSHPSGGPTGDSCRDDVLRLKSLVLLCADTLVHTIHRAVAEQRQVEVGAVIDGYLRTLIKLCDSESNAELTVAMLGQLNSGDPSYFNVFRSFAEKLSSMLTHDDKVSLQNIFMSCGICEHLRIFLSKITTWRSISQQLAISVVQLLGQLLADSNTAKERFAKSVGYDSLLEGLKNLGQPTKELLETLIDLMLEDKHSRYHSQLVRNSLVALMLIDWLPDIAWADLQTWLAERLHQVVSGNSWSRMQCCEHGINAQICACLQRHQDINNKALGYLLDLLESTGSMSISADELKQLMRLLRSSQALSTTKCSYSAKLIHVVSKMARPISKLVMPQTYFDFQSEDSGMIATDLGRWSGSGFTFHAWLCIEAQVLTGSYSASKRRQLYSVLTANGSGFEAFLTSDSVLVISVCTKKDTSFDIPVLDCILTDGKWHCIDVVHQTSKRPFGTSQLSVYVDEVLQLNTQLKFPSLTDDISVCRIACGNIPPPVDQSADSGDTDSLSSMSPSGDEPSKSVKGFWSRMSFSRISRQSSPTTTTSTTTPTGGGGSRFGTAVSLCGCLSDVALFTEPLLDSHVQAIYRLGPNRHLCQSEDGSTPTELPYKPLVMYHAMATSGTTCVDLTSNGHNAVLSGHSHVCRRYEIKDMINCIGGIPVFFALLEQAVDDVKPPALPVDLLTSSPTYLQPNGNSPGLTDDNDDVVTIVSSGDSDDVAVQLLSNPVSSFFLLLRSFVYGSKVNQEALMRDNSLAIISSLLQKANSSHLDETFHKSVMLLMEIVSQEDENKKLLHELHRHLLFDWRIWSRCPHHVCVGHIQYLRTIIKKDRKHFRKKYGVQCLLDIIRLYYGSTSWTANKMATSLANDGMQSIRLELLSLVQFYIGREIDVNELSQILGFICAVHNEHLVCEVLDLVIVLLELPGKRDQIYLLMFEPGMGELLYVLLTLKNYSVDLKEKILKIITLLLKTDKVYEKSKARLRLLDSNLYPGLVSLMVDTLPSVYMTKHMLEQVFIAESAASINASLYIIQTLAFCDISVKLEAVRQLMKVLLSKPNIPKLFARQLSWQLALIRLFILRSLNNNPPPKWLSSAPGSSTLDAHQIVSPANDAPSTPTWNTTSDRLVEIAEEENRIKISEEESPIRQTSSLFNFTYSLSDPYRLTGDPMVRSASQQNHNDLWDSTTDDQLRRRPLAPRSSSISSHSSTLSDTLLSSSLSSVDFINARLGRGGGSETILTSSMSSMDWRQAKLIMEDDSDSLASAVKRIGLRGVALGAHGDADAEKQEELCQNLLIILYMIMWKGVDINDELAWKERGQVFAAVAYTSGNNQLIISKTELYRKLLELTIQGCILDIKEFGMSHLGTQKNALQLMKLSYYFLCIEDGPQENKFSEQLVEDMLTMLDLLGIWQIGNDWTEMERIGVRCVLAFSGDSNLDVCSIASARLHSLVQTRPVEKVQESCFILGTIDTIISMSIKNHTDQYNFLIPVMKALLEKCEHMLNMATYLPSLPSTRSSPSFADDFREYCQSEEWKSFMRKQVDPSKDQYQANIYEGLRIEMTSFIGECHEQMMVNGHKRDREKGEAKLKFEEEFIAAFRSRLQQEMKRFKTAKQIAHNQNLSVTKEWKQASSFFTSERGIWVDKMISIPQHWKLSTFENLSRMRPKLIVNTAFDSHADASRLRDNQGCEEKSCDEGLISLSLVKEAKVCMESGDDRLGDEEWNLITSVTATTPTTSNGTTTTANPNTLVTNAPEKTSKEKLILSEECELVTATEVIVGRLDVTTTHLYFFDCSPYRENGITEDIKCALDELREIHFRRYNLRRSALEFFLIHQTNYFINFQQKVRNKVYSRILSLRPPNLIYYQSRSPAELLKSSGLTQKWVDREISNFEYLMHLNTISGRTYNDLSQYPVFPWILCDYTSKTLNLDDPSVYRDLSRPIGVVNPKNEREVREKYEHFEDPTGTIEKFHYGTHYSNPAGVMHYLLRLEPFTSLHIQLQSGRFDVADRQFHSIPAMWQGLIDNCNDVKELIPEFFYLPEFLINMNEFDLGRLQILKDKVDDVILPAWASSPYDFINKHQKALESDYVSSHLHNWIDLIFGYKQQGPAAVEALNVFYYCTYEGALDLDTVTDPARRKAFEGMINNFGQTPCQLLKEPHPKRLTSAELMARTVISKIERPMKVLMAPSQLKSFCVEAAPVNNSLVFVSVPRNQVRSFIQQAMSDTMIAITQDGTLLTHGWLPYDKSVTNFFTFDKDVATSNPKIRKKLCGSFSPRVVVSAQLFAVSHDARLVFSVGHWDNSLRVYSVPRSRQVAQLIRHTDVVTCVAIDHCSTRLITGSADSTSIIWQITQQAGQCTGVTSRPLQILYGHDSKVTSVAIFTELDMAVSGSKDGTVIVHSVTTGTYLRTLRPSYEKGWTLSVEQLALSDTGQICVYCRHTAKTGITGEQVKLTVHLYSVNGKHLSKEVVTVPITDMITADGHLVFGNEEGVVTVKQLYGLQTVATVPLHAVVTCVSPTNGCSHILVALKDSNLIILAVKKQPEIK